MLDSLVKSKTRIKLLLIFFINPETRAYLWELAKEFGESTNSVRLELNRLTKAKLLVFKIADVPFCIMRIRNILFSETSRI